MTRQITRRSFLARSAIVGCSAAASPLLTPVTLAAAPWDTRLVVIILRGGMDGLDLVQPYGDPAYAPARGLLAGGPADGAADLDGYFAMHPRLVPLQSLWQRGELGFVHAVSTPYRNKRSHFDGQDLLEAGTPELGDSRDGWLNRVIAQVPGVESRTAFAIGRDRMKLLDGPAPVTEWFPDSDLDISPQALRLAELVMQQDPSFHAALSQAIQLSDGRKDGPAAKTHVKVAAFAAEQLRGDTRVASFSINGWDTHRRQSHHFGVALDQLVDTILTLRDGLGPAWDKTAVLAMTEFGRTVRTNGTKGTDHGTGGAMVLAGGAIRGGRVYGDWPGLDEAALYQRRDLMPTGDVRGWAAWIMRAATGLDRTALETSVFPGLDMGADPGLLR